MDSALSTLAFGLPISAVIIALIVDNAVANKCKVQIRLATIEAEKQVAIAKAQAGGGAPGGAGEGVGP